MARRTPQHTSRGAAPPLPGVAVTKHRLDALSDAIYAIALTLLVLNLSLPREPLATEAALRGVLLGLVPNVGTWLLSFWVVALFWIAHQRLYHLVEALDARLVFIELFQLSLITLFPFTSALMGSYGHTATAAAVYAGHLLAIALVLALRTATFPAPPRTAYGDRNARADARACGLGQRSLPRAPP